MKKMLLGTLSAAALTMGATGAFAAAHSSDMASVTCEQFLALEAMDQETHATVLMTAMMDDASMGAEGATDSSMGDEAMSDDTAAMAADDETMSTDPTGTDDAAMDSTSGDTTSMDSAGTDSAAMDGSSTDSTSMESSDTAAMDSTSTGTATTGTDSEMASGDTGTGTGMGADMQLSPTAAALVTICENSANEMGSSSN